MRGLLKIVAVLRRSSRSRSESESWRASELGGEIVTLHTAGPDGDVETRVWIVDDGGHAWLRAGMPDNTWLQRIDANPDVVVERRGEAIRFRAVPVRDDPAIRDRIHELMREHYTWADRVVGQIRDGTKSVPIRLDPVAIATPD